MKALIFILVAACGAQEPVVISEAPYPRRLLAYDEASDGVVQIYGDFLNTFAGCKWLVGNNVDAPLIWVMTKPDLADKKHRAGEAAGSTIGLMPDVPLSVLAHELGHVYGFQHTDQPGELMYVGGQRLADEDAAQQLTNLIDPCHRTAP